MALFELDEKPSLNLQHSLGSSLLVWFVAIAYILCLNLWPLNDIKDHIFNTDDMQMWEDNKWLSAYRSKYHLVMD